MNARIKIIWTMYYFIIQFQIQDILSLIRKKIKPMLYQNILIYHIDDFFEPETFAILDAPKWKKSYTLRLIDYWGLCNNLKSQFFFHIRFNICT